MLKTEIIINYYYTAHLEALAPDIDPSLTFTKSLKRASCQLHNMLKS